MKQRVGGEKVKKKKKTVRNTVIIMLFVAIGIVGIFWFMTNQDKNKEGVLDTNATEVEKLLEKDMINNYPETPKEVLKLYSRFTKCMYNEEVNDETLKGLLEKKRQLYDEKLLEKNPFEVQMKMLKNEIKEYRDNKRDITNYVVDKSSKIQVKKVKKEEVAKGGVVFFIKNASNYEKVYEEFTLKVDKEGKWRILGWSRGQNKEIEEEK